MHRLEIDSVQTALQCAKVFDDFGLTTAVKECEEYLNHPININVENAIALYELNRQCIERSEVIEECLKLFASNTRAVLTSVAFSRARLETILTIFDLPKLSINSETDLLDALRDYAEMHGALPSHTVDGNDGRFTELVKPALAKVRLLTLAPKDLVSNESVRDLFTDQQIICVLANLIVPENPLYKLPEGVSLCKTNRAVVEDESYLQFRDFVETTNGSSVQILADTAQIDSQIYETPKTSVYENRSGQESSVDYTPSKVQGLQKKLSNGTEIAGEADVGTPIGNSTADSSVFVARDDTLTGEM